MQIEENDEKIIQLTRPEKRAVVCEQLSNLLHERSGVVSLSELPELFAKRYGFNMKYSDFGVTSCRDLILQLKNNFVVRNIQGIN